MSLRSPLIQQWWPATQSLDLVEGSAAQVADALHAEIHRFLPHEALSASWEVCTDVDAAFRLAPEFTNVPTVFIILPTHSQWSVLWNNSFLCNGYDSLCHCLTTNHGLTTLHWSAHDEWTTFQSGAHFTYRRKIHDQIIKRSVHVGQSDKQWDFHMTGDPLAEEDVTGYSVRRKRDRLNEERLCSLLSRLMAQPWQETFYALQQQPVFILRRENFTTTISRRPREDVLKQADAASSLPVE